MDWRRRDGQLVIVLVDELATVCIHREVMLMKSSQTRMGRGRRGGCWAR